MDYGILGDTLSDRLYKNTYLVADRTVRHITVGIASNASYGSIAANIANAANISLTNALRITRTEAHRVTQTVQYETVRKARSRGADVVKQWDSTLDNRTRPSHAALDGQIRELDEPFKAPTNGHEAEHPGAFGIASEDINCRCVCLQRARWAIDQTELEKYVGDLDGMDDGQLDKMADSLGVTRDELIRKSNGVIEQDGSVNHRISSTSYNDFKKKYWERSRTVDRKSGTGYNKDAAINAASNSLILRKINESGQVINPMNEALYLRMKSGLERMGCSVVEASEEDVKLLDFLEAEAISDEKGIIHRGSVPSASAFFEEIIHYQQIRLYGPTGIDFVERAAREVAANRMLLRNGKYYGFTEEDFEDIRENLKTWEADFTKRVGVPYEESEIDRGI